MRTLRAREVMRRPNLSTRHLMSPALYIHTGNIYISKRVTYYFIHILLKEHSPKVSTSTLKANPIALIRCADVYLNVCGYIRDDFIYSVVCKCIVIIF